MPQAVLKLKQGFGRLIRAQTNRGVVVVLDRRILTKQYGRIFLASLAITSERRLGWGKADTGSVLGAGKQPAPDSPLGRDFAILYN